MLIFTFHTDVRSCVFHWSELKGLTLHHFEPDFQKSASLITRLDGSAYIHEDLIEMLHILF